MVALDAPVQRYVPEFRISDPDASSRITVRELLNQTSGLSDAGFPEGLLPQPTSIRERVESLRSARLVAAPGLEFHYFNPNYAVLARLVEIVARESFSDYMREHVFAPLGMPNTFHAVTSQAVFAQAVNIARGHLMTFGFAVPCQEMSGYLGGSAGVVSTGRDMARYLIFQGGDGSVGSLRILSRESMDLLHTPPPGVSGGYAMGWVATREKGLRAIEHSGILSTYYAETVILPDREIGIVLLYNIQSVPSMMFAFGRIKSGILALLTQAPPISTPAMTVRRWGLLLGIMTLLTVTLGFRSYRRRLIWVERVRRETPWKPALHFVWWVLPSAVLIALPWIVLETTGRSFGYEELLRAMPGVAVWLAACGVLGVLNATSRIVLLRRRPAPTHPDS